MTDLKERLRSSATAFGEPLIDLDGVARRAARDERRRRGSAAVTAFVVVAFAGSFVLRAFGGEELRGPRAIPDVLNGSIAFRWGSFAEGSVRDFRVGIVEPRSGSMAFLDGYMNAGAWSPDGTRFVFVREGESREDMAIWTATADGGDTRQLTGGTTGDFGPRWSPDGGRLLFFRFDGSVADGAPPVRTPLLVTMDADGGPARTIAGGDRTGIFSAEWSPDGQRILMVLDDADDDADDLSLALVDADGTDERVLLQRPMNEVQWSADGTEIFLSSNGDALAVDVADGSIRTVAEGLDRQGLSHLAASPDGSSIAYTKPIGYADGEELWLVDVDGGEPRLVAQDLQWREPEIAWAPDGTAIAFVRDGDIWTVDIGTGAETRLTSSPENETAPDWGPAPSEPPTGS